MAYVFLQVIGVYNLFWSVLTKLSDGKCIFQIGKHFDIQIIKVFKVFSKNKQLKKI